MTAQDPRRGMDPDYPAFLSESDIQAANRKAAEDHARRASHADSLSFLTSPEPTATADSKRRSGSTKSDTGEEFPWQKFKQPRRRSLAASLALTVLSTLIPGLGLLGATRRALRVLGAVTATLAAASLGYIVYLASTHQQALVKLASKESFLTAATPILAVLGIIWVALITLTHLATRPFSPRTGQRVIGALTVSALAFSVAAPTAVAARYARDAFLLVNSVLPDAADVLSTSRPSLDAKLADPWAAIDRVNILLLGADGDASRAEAVKKFGVRTDTIMVASIDTKTGNTLLIQIPRNTQNTPFPKGSEMNKAFPKGFSGQPEGDWYINSILPKVELDYPDLLKGNTYRGAEALKQGVEGVTGLKIDYFVMLNIDGLRQLIDAMGGVTVNINQRLPMGGNSENKQASGWLNPGPNQHLNGYEGLWYARSRWNTDDFDRMRRQSCLVNAIVKQADPATLLTRFESIAAASADMLQTDIPSQDAAAIIDLAFRVKNASVSRLVFTPGQNGYSYANPDFVAMRAAVRDAITPPPPQPVTTQTTSAATPTTTAPKPKPSPSASKASASPSASPSPSEEGAQAVTGACSYTGP